MKQLLILFVCLFFYTQLSIAQKEGNVWYFGDSAGLDFNSGVPVAITDGAMNTIEGCSSICDSKGVLLFYTDGISIWNRNHIIMPNGSDLQGDISSSQSAIIIRKPQSTINYYVITVDARGEENGLMYSEVNMDLQGGLGDVTTNKNMLLVSPTCEKVTAVKHRNNSDIWIITQLFNTPGFNSFLLTENGISSPVTFSNVGTMVADSLMSLGCLKASFDGSEIVSVTNYGNYIEIFNFDNLTGMLSNPLKFTGFEAAFNGPPNSYGAYGAEFSPNGNFLYVSLYKPTEVYQLNLKKRTYTDIENSRHLIGSISSISSLGGALQIGPDGKVYMARAYSNYLAVINNPDSLGLACNFESDAVDLKGKTSYLGLPNYSTSVYALSGSEELVASTVKPPNIFTPNNDGSNDVFFPGHIEWTMGMTLEIYNRWGVKLYTSKSNSGWDGRNMNGLEAPDGTYYYVVSDSDSLSEKGYLSLVR